MSQKIFKRDEKKYMLSALEYKLMVRELEQNMQRDKYFRSSIFNVYFDTPHNDLVIASIAGPNYKYKVRARSYGAASGGKVFLEIKSKLDGTTYKRRVEMSEAHYDEYIASGTYGADDDSQVMREIDYIFKKDQLAPKLFMGYERESYAAKDGSGLRVTIDSNLRSRTDNLALEKTDGCELYFDEPTYIMEIKSHGGMPAWLVDALSHHQIYPSSFSKYGKIYQKNQQANVAVQQGVLAYA